MTVARPTGRGVRWTGVSRERLTKLAPSCDLQSREKRKKRRGAVSTHGGFLFPNAGFLNCMKRKILLLGCVCGEHVDANV